jgi:hypothetical protein
MARLNKAKEPIPLAVGSCCVSRRDAYRSAKLALPLVPQYPWIQTLLQGATIGPKRRFVPDPTPGWMAPPSTWRGVIGHHNTTALGFTGTTLTGG